MNESTSEPVSYGEDYIAYQVNRSALRKFIRKIYLNNILKYNSGKAIDFGSGAGELLGKLPEGSIGLEINDAAVKYCRNLKLNVELYNPDTDLYQLNDMKKDYYKTLIISHVLEHFENPTEVLNNLLKACNRLLINRVVIIVPCIKGFKFDKTHKTFIEKDFFKQSFIEDNGFKISVNKYFPFNLKFAGNYLTYNELTLVLDRTNNGK
jgi:hypothetical protein